jgi:hypothetical protein
LHNNNKGLERVLRYCARVILASEKLQRLSDNTLVHKPDKQWKKSNGQSYAQHPISLSPIEFIEKLATLISPSRIHRHRYFGVLQTGTSELGKIVSVMSR